jgi:osmotically-inducible protein OsmY
VTAPNTPGDPPTEKEGELVDTPAAELAAASEAARGEMLELPNAVSPQERKNMRLAEWVRLVLYATGYGSLRVVEVSVRAGVAYLGGRVPNYHLKQIAQTTALTVPGIEHVQNDLEVDPADCRG